MRRFALLADTDLDRPRMWREYRSTARYAVFRSLEEENVALARARLAWRASESESILALAARAFGDLHGRLVGLPDDTLDRAHDGDWSLRRVLTHLVEIERRYAAQTLYAAHRGEDEPLRMNEGDPRLPEKDGDLIPGGVDTLVARLAVARDESDARLGGIPDAALGRPAEWAGARVDVRFRLHRFASHLVEHTIQCEKALANAGVPESEARRVVRRIWAARGELEAAASDDTLSALDAAQALRAATLDATP